MPPSEQSTPSAVETTAGRDRPFARLPLEAGRRAPERSGTSKVSPALFSAVLGATIASLLWIAFDRVRQPAASNDAATSTQTVGKVGSVGTVNAAETRTTSASSQPSPSSVSHPQRRENLPTAPVRELTAAEERDEVVARIDGSGAAPAELVPIARKLQTEWAAILHDADEQATVRISRFKCFKAGCYLALNHPQGFAHEPLASRFIDAKAFHEWPGPKFRSGPIVGSAGGVDITWVLFAPDEQKSAP